MARFVSEEKLPDGLPCRLLSHAEPLKHFIDDHLRGVFASEVTEGIQRIVHTDRYSIQPDPR